MVTTKKLPVLDDQKADLPNLSVLPSLLTEEKEIMCAYFGKLEHKSIATCFHL